MAQQAAAPRIALRADASPRIGGGHLARCRALAEALRAGGAEVRFISRAYAGGALEALERAGHVVLRLDGGADELPRAADYDWQRDAAQCAVALDAAGFVPDWLVVDHYGLDARWERQMHARATRVLAVDDLADRPHDCDLLLDQNLAVDAIGRYRGLVPDRCRLLLGPRWALLRSEFGAGAPRRERDGKLRRLVVSLGSIDADNVTGAVLRAIAALPRRDFDVDVVLGVDCPHCAAVKGQAASMGRVTVHVQPSQLSRLLGEADLALGAGGVSLWERCSLGLPGITVAVAANQAPGCDALAALGGTLYLGPVAQLDETTLAVALAAFQASPPWVRFMAGVCAALVDGDGARRVAALMLRLPLTLRPAQPADCTSVLAWRNHPDTRRHAIDPRPIPREAHERWYAATLVDPGRELLIGESGGEAVGVLRYDLGGDIAEVSIYLVPGCAGQGLGPALLEAGAQWLRARHPSVRRVRARVLADNAVSQRAFAAAGFAPAIIEFERELA